jgi:hypothetical protein
MSKTWRNFVDEKIIRKNIIATQQRLKDRGRYPSEEDIPIIEERLHEIMAGALVVHCTSSETLKAIKEQGIFKSVFEKTGDSSSVPSSYPYPREQIREILFGKTWRQRFLKLFVKQPDIVYAALFPDWSAKTYGYGNIRIVLKDSVRVRATVTRKDTMEFDWVPAGFLPAEALAVAVPLLELSFLLMPFATASEAQNWTSVLDLTGQEDYIEVQIHGGVTVDDIAEVQEKISTQLPSDTIISEEVREWLRSKQIPLRIV